MARNWSPVVLDTIDSSTDATSYDTVLAPTFVVGRTYILGMLNTKATLPDIASSVITIGGVQTFTNIGSYSLFNTVATPLFRLSVFILKCTTGVTATNVRVAFSANQTSCRAYLHEIPDTTLADPFVRVTVATSVDSAGTIVLTPTTPDSTDNLFISFAGTALNSSNDVPNGTGWVALGTGVGGASPSGTIESAYNEGGVATQLTMSTAGNTNRGLLIVEIGAEIAAAATELILPPRIARVNTLLRM